ncbi:NAD(P)-binding domain-containing protein [Streptomyces lateritius]|uniref:NAD(P)-binding domain-containing protein n=1 Tax=Streptomyces lateritius TaxID=67313 RepID=A0ABW6YIB3_9ACTN
MVPRASAPWSAFRRAGTNSGCAVGQPFAPGSCPDRILSWRSRTRSASFAVGAPWRENGPVRGSSPRHRLCRRTRIHWSRARSEVVGTSPECGESMRIGGPGPGNMADALATHRVRAGHEVFVGGRDETEGPAARDAHRGPSGHGSLQRAADFGEVLLTALPCGSGVDVVSGLQTAVSGKVLLDCAIPVGPGFRLLTEDGPAGRCPGATVGCGCPGNVRSTPSRRLRNRATSICSAISR